MENWNVFFDPEDCASFAPGHITHWIAAKRARPGDGESGTILDVESRRLTIRVSGGSSSTWVHHDAAALADLALGSDVEVFTGLSIVAVHEASGCRRILNCVRDGGSMTPCGNRRRRLFGSGTDEQCTPTDEDTRSGRDRP